MESRSKRSVESTTVTHPNHFRKGTGSMIDTLEWIIGITVVLCALRYGIRREVKHNQQKNKEREDQELTAMLAKKYAPTPIVAASEAKHFVDSIPYSWQITPNGKPFRPRSRRSE